jgi:hypothetical protein
MRAWPLAPFLAAFLDRADGAHASGRALSPGGDRCWNPKFAACRHRLDDLDVGEIALAETERPLVPGPHPIDDVDLVHGRIADAERAGVHNLEVGERGAAGRVVATTGDAGLYRLEIPAA